MIFAFSQIVNISDGLLKRLISVESLEPAIDCLSLNGVPLGSFSLRAAVCVCSVKSAEGDGLISENPRFWCLLAISE